MWQDALVVGGHGTFSPFWPFCPEDSSYARFVAELRRHLAFGWIQTTQTASFSALSHFGMRSRHRHYFGTGNMANVGRQQFPRGAAEPILPQCSTVSQRSSGIRSRTISARLSTCVVIARRYPGIKRSAGRRRNWILPRKTSLFRPIDCPCPSNCADWSMSWITPNIR